MGKATTERIYLVCDTTPNRTTLNGVIRVYKTVDAAYRFLGKYVSEMNRATHTSYLSIVEKEIGNTKNGRIVGLDVAAAKDMKIIEEAAKREKDRL